jgi:RNA polymerase sigma-70 factor (ECF subfamily)
VNASRNTGGTGRDQADGTLGELLYARVGKPRVAEEDWVRLIRAIAAGDQGALHALYERTHRPAFTLILRITKDRQTAEELTVDLFHDIWRRAPAYDVAGGTVLGWVMNQARSRAIDRLRYEQRKKRVDPYPEQEVALATQSEPDEVVRLGEQGRLLREALLILTADERQTIETTFFSELTHQETAARLKQPLGTVKTRIRSGLAKLRQALAKVGIP